MNVGGKTALVTGATGGLGRAIAKALAARGSTIVLSSRKADELDELAESLPGDEHTTVVCDLADEDAALTLLEKAGDIDVLVANAALPGGGRLEGFSQNEIGRALRVNLESPVRMTRELLPGWQHRNSGHFVFISSMSGIRRFATGIPIRGHKVRAFAGLRSICEKTCVAAALAFLLSRQA